ncbi:MAG: hypothetical protein IJK24_07920 [Oscillospiraceae bacterium]|nr:hypothetical protein [Oscillospiraceae bacterium]
METSEKKVIKLKFLNMWPTFNPETSRIVSILKKNGFEVEICDDADYIYVSVFKEYYKYLEAGDQIRIMFSGENVVPDFNLIDYAISSYPIQYNDRHFRYPQGIARKRRVDYLVKRSAGEIVFGPECLAEKTIFANFCASHESENGIRGGFFKRLCEYKKVDSIGTYLNNTGAKVSFRDNTKSDYQKKCKFTLCFESTSHPGFFTEKIVDAFYADTIPVYYGDPQITEIFNPKAFINVADYPSFDEAIQAIIELDQDDEKYLQMLNQPVLNDPTYPERLDRELEAWILHIFEQPIEKAYRRSRVYIPKAHENRLRYWLRMSARIDPIVNRLKWIKRRLKKLFHRA